MQTREVVKVGSREGRRGIVRSLQVAATYRASETEGLCWMCWLSRRPETALTAARYYETHAWL